MEFFKNAFHSLVLCVSLRMKFCSNLTILKNHNKTDKMLLKHKY